ncbi:hypothetical protein RBC47_30430 [Pseudomonas fluorescens]|uniref:hypothetical protein n=1 Tax=Pseudomonas fluorescens TaxID=294 RepID=UPI003835A5E3
MFEITQTVIVVALAFLIDRFLKPYPLRRWLGMMLVVAGAIGCVAVSQVQLLGFDMGLMSVLAVPVGAGLFVTRRRFSCPGNEET